MTNLTECPICKSSLFSDFLVCKDYTVSGDKFTIVECNNCNFKFTNPRPSNGVLGDYYKSDDYISHSDTKKGFIATLYHIVRDYTLKRKIKLVERYVSRGTILDYGCGTGMFLKVSKKSGWNALGMEPDSGARSIALNMALDVNSDKSTLSVSHPNQKFNAITLWHVLEHITDLDETLAFLKSALLKDGVLIIAVPNYRSLDARTYKEFWAAYDVPRHLYHFDVDSVSKLLLKAGFELECTRPMKFDSFYVSMLSEKYKHGSISYINAVAMGIRSNLSARLTKEYSSRIYIFRHGK